MFSLPRVSRKTIFVLLFLGIIQVSCTNHSSPAQSFAERACIDSLVRANRNLDSMEIWLEKFSREQNHIGLIFVCRELGKRYREKSRFSEALAIHNRGLRLAIELADTLEIADAYNNIGTDLRRMGMLSEAADSHYLALHIAEQYTSNEPRQNRKNYVYALNGLGNIYKALDNRNEAEHYFRRALKIETEMGNELGQAINWANLGSIYKYRQQYDSAYLCFTRSLEHNERARSKLGIALCHTHFGQIHECRGDYEQAFGEYNISYRLLKAIPDKWNLLKSCTALASLHFRRGNLPKAKKILDEALITAREIHSFGHLEELHLLRSEYYERLGICRNALHELKLSHQYRDSLLTDQNESMVYETQIRYERDKKAREIAELNEQNERQIRSRRQVTITSGIVILLTFMILGVLVYALRMKIRSQQTTRRMAAMQQNFFTNITHEFRTPLTVILGLAERQMAASSYKACNKDMQVIIRQSNTLLELINQLLGIAKIRSAITTPEWHTGDIIALLHLILENIRICSEQKLIEIEFAPTLSSLKMDFIPDYMQKILRNLLINAVKFTSQGGKILITVTANKGQAAITIADSGMGISQEDLPYIFEPFYQGNNLEAYLGTGIGLSMVRQMTEAMGGTIEVFSIEGQGSSFIVRLPLHHGKEFLSEWIPGNNSPEKSGSIVDEIPENNSVTNSDNKQKNTILIAEDNSDVASYISSELRSDYHLLLARNGREALAKAEAYMPDLILTDVMMPEMDGYELCRAIRNSETLNHIPIIIISARSDEPDRLAGLATGADAYLVKPFNTEELQLQIRKLLEQRRILREKYARQMQVGNMPPQELPEANREFMTRLHQIIYSEMADPTFNSETIANKICMSRSQLNRKVKSITDMDTATYIRQARLQFARNLLVSSDNAIGDIVIRCGFEYQSYFNRIFKQHFGMTPMEYRKRNRK